MSLTTEDALAVLARNRGDNVVVTTMGAIGYWPQLADGPLDFAYMPSSMGQGVPLGLGLALAQPGRGVIVVTGDGSLLMNLGCLVTVASYPADLFVVLIDNGLYEVTGGQPTVGSQRVDFGLMAKAAGIERVYSASEIDAWEQAATTALTKPGPVFIWLKVTGKLGLKTPKPPRAMPEQLQRLQQGLADLPA